MDVMNAMQMAMMNVRIMKMDLTNKINQVMKTIETMKNVTTNNKTKHVLLKMI